MSVSLDLSLDWMKFSNKPVKDTAEGKLEIKKLSIRIANCVETVTIEALAEAISVGRTYCNAVFRLCPTTKKRARSQRNFESQQIFSLDLDDGTYTDLEQILNHCEDNEIEPAIVYESFSSSATQRKWRVIFVTDRPTFCGDEAKAIIRFFNQSFQGDTAVIDSARLLFATTSEKVHYVNSHMVMSLEEIRAKLAPYSKTETVESQFFDNGTLQQQQKLISHLTPKQRDLIKRIWQESREAILDPVNSYHKGHYMAVFNSAVKMAKISYLMTNVIQHVLLRWIEEAGETYHNWKYDPEDVINSGIAFGRSVILF